MNHLARDLHPRLIKSGSATAGMQECDGTRNSPSFILSIILMILNLTEIYCPSTCRTLTGYVLKTAISSSYLFYLFVVELHQ